VRDLRGGGDVALGKAEPSGAVDRLMQVVLSLAPAPRGALHAGEQLARQRSARMLLSAVFGLRHGGDGMARGDGCHGGIGKSLGERLAVERVLVGEHPQLLLGGRGDGGELRGERLF
jgi:hypothetical protein